MKVTAYLRVSSDQQTTDNQLPAIEAWCEGRGYELTEIYAESESAWRNGHQKELARLLGDLRSGRRKFDILLIWSLDRLSRQGIGAILQLMSTFETHGCHVISIQESWTVVNGPMRELFIAMAAWPAKFESDKRSERTKAGLARAVTNGKKLGRPAGSKDKGRRKRTGYLLRYADHTNKG